MLAAKVANELLDVDNVRASFVLTKIDNVVYISARSIDDVNVQVIMIHKLGPGHGTVAGAQLMDLSIEDAKEEIRKLLGQLWEDGEL